jgi:hypothetical protein
MRPQSPRLQAWGNQAAVPIAARNWIAINTLSNGRRPFPPSDVSFSRQYTDIVQL